MTNMKNSAASIPALDPSAQAFLAGLPAGKPIYELTPVEARAVLAGVQEAVAVDLPPAKVEDRVLSVGPTERVSIRVVSPREAKGALPAVLYMHGGGWVMGDKHTHDRLVRELAVGAEAVIIFVDYDRSPESRFPIAIEQALAVASYVVTHSEEFGIDAKRFAIAGDSVGGNMAAALALIAKDRSDLRFCGQLLFYPVTDASMASESYKMFAEGPWLTAKAMAWYWHQYLPDVARRAEILASPLNASVEQLRHLPPALVIVDENDVLRDEGEAYARKLAEAGVPTTTVRYNGTIHDFMMLNPISKSPATRGAVAQAIGYLRHLFAPAQ